MTDTVRTPREVDAVDAVPQLPKLLAYGMQHVLVMSAGAVAPPLILGAAMNLPAETACSSRSATSSASRWTSEPSRAA